MNPRPLMSVIVGLLLSGCVGQAGIGADGAVTAERETSVYRYTKTLPDGSQVTAEAIIAKKAQVQGLEFRTASDGSVVMLLDSAESGDRQGDKALETVNRSLAMMEYITGKGGRGERLALVQQRKTAKELRQESRNELRRQESLRRTEEAETKRLEAERQLLLEKERLRKEAEQAELEDSYS